MDSVTPTGEANKGARGRNTVRPHSVVVSLLVCAVGGLPAAARAATSPSPTIVLVHGACDNATSWDGGAVITNAAIGNPDRVIPPAFERFMAARAGSHTVEVSASHAAHVSQPGATDLVLAAAEAG